LKFIHTSSIFYMINKSKTVVRENKKKKIIENYIDSTIETLLLSTPELKLNESISEDIQERFLRPMIQKIADMCYDIKMDEFVIPTHLNIEDTILTIKQFYRNHINQIVSTKIREIVDMSIYDNIQENIDHFMKIEKLCKSIFNIKVNRQLSEKVELLGKGNIQNYDEVSLLMNISGDNRIVMNGIDFKKVIKQSVDTVYHSIYCRDKLIELCDIVDNILKNRTFDDRSLGVATKIISAIKNFISENNLEDYYPFGSIIRKLRNSNRQSNQPTVAYDTTKFMKYTRDNFEFIKYDTISSINVTHPSIYPSALSSKINQILISAKKNGIKLSTSRQYEIHSIVSDMINDQIIFAREMLVGENYEINIDQFDTSKLGPIEQILFYADTGLLEDIFKNDDNLCMEIYDSIYGFDTVEENADYIEEMNNVFDHISCLLDKFDSLRKFIKTNSSISKSKLKDIMERFAEIICCITINGKNILAMPIEDIRKVLEKYKECVDFKIKNHLRLSMLANIDKFEGILKSMNFYASADTETFIYYKKGPEKVKSSLKQKFGTIRINSSDIISNIKKLAKDYNNIKRMSDHIVINGVVQFI